MRPRPSARERPLVRVAAGVGAGLRPAPRAISDIFLVPALRLRCIIDSRPSTAGRYSRMNVNLARSSLRWRSSYPSPSGPRSSPGASIWSDAGYGGLYLIFLALLITLFAVLGPGTLAVILAKPNGENWKTARRVALGILGPVCFVIGGAFVALYFFALEPPIVVFATMALLLPVGIAAIVVLVRDMMVSKPAGGWPKVLGLIGLVLLVLYSSRLFGMLQSTGGLITLAILGPVLLLAGAIVRPVPQQHFHTHRGRERYRRSQLTTDTPDNSRPLTHDP